MPRSPCGLQPALSVASASDCLGPEMSRRRRPLTFRQTDVSRLLRAYRAAGAAEPMLKITNDELIAIPAAPPKDSGPALEAERTPLEQWRAKRGQG